MTPKQIDAMEAGLEIDELAARLVMGWNRLDVDGMAGTPSVSGWYHSDGRFIRDNFRPSTHIKLTQMLWAMLIHQGWRVNMDHEDNWIVWALNKATDVLVGSEAPTLELAMTKAALKAVMLA